MTFPGPGYCRVNVIRMSPTGIDARSGSNKWFSYTENKVNTYTDRSGNTYVFNSANSGRWISSNGKTSIALCRQ